VSVTIKRQRDRAFWQQHVKTWQQSSLRPSDYAHQHQLCKAQFDRWRYRLKQEAALGKGIFIPIAIAQAQTASTYPLVMSGVNGLQIRLELPAEQAIGFAKALLCGQ